MAGVEDVDKLMTASSDAESRKVVDEPGISYARVFAETNGRGKQEEKAYGDIVEHYGEGYECSQRAFQTVSIWRDSSSSSSSSR